MERTQAADAILIGANVARSAMAKGADLLVTGEMGIANTTAAACLISAFTGAGPREVTGRGTGIDDATWEVKVKVVEAAVRCNRPDPGDPIGTLAALGGLEHAALVGVILAGAAQKVPVILDGVSTNAAAIVACALAPQVSGYLLAGHRSVEPGASVALSSLGLEPLLDLALRLGEGTGGLLAVPIVRAAAAALADMATFQEAGIG
jgi:nicotinate-nucleotide--dimethylbenzimidazole phosphoribosyltransferase